MLSSQTGRSTAKLLWSLCSVSTAGDKVGLLGAGDTGSGCCGADTEGSGTSFAASANLSSRSSFGLGGKALFSTGGGALLSTGPAVPTGALGTHTSRSSQQGRFYHWLEIPQVSAVSVCHPPGSVNLDGLYIKTQIFKHNPGLVPSIGQVSGCFLVL